MSLNIFKFLKETPPFSYLSDEEISYIESNLKLDYINKDVFLFKSGDYPENLIVILKGSFSLKKDGKVIDILEKGDFIGDTSIIFNEPISFDIKTLESSIVLLIPKNVFNELLQKHLEFKDYFTKTTIEKLSEGYKHLQQANLDDVSVSLIKNFDLLPPIFCENEEDIVLVAKKMSENNLSFCLVGNENNLQGIITDKDLKNKVVAEGKDPKQLKAKDIKTYPVETISSDNFVFEATLKMIKNNIKRLPVVEGEKVIGVIEDRIIFIKQTKNILTLINEIEHAKNNQELKTIYLSVKESIEDLFNTGKNIEIIQKYITEINDKITKKVIENVLSDYENVPNFAFLVLGSEGRKEQTIVTDIDNAIVYEKEEDKDAVEEIGRKIIDNLLKVGFPKCPGDIMSSNPQWVRTVKDWKIKIEDWFSKPDAENIMMTSIFFDFRTVYGNIDLEKQLRDFVFKEVKSYKNFLVAMTLKALEFEPPIGLFKDFVVEKSGEHQGELDLKKGGIFPITQGVRVLALENSIPETNTIDRIRRLEEKIGKSLSLGLIESFKILQTFRLKTQLEKIKEGKYPDNYINPSKLTKIERDLLKDAFKVVKKFQETLGVHFRLRV